MRWPRHCYRLARVLAAAPKEAYLHAPLVQGCTMNLSEAEALYCPLNIDAEAWLVVV